MTVFGTYSIEEVLPRFAINSKFKKKISIAGFKVKANSERLLLFNKQLQEFGKIFVLNAILKKTTIKGE